MEDTVALYTEQSVDDEADIYVDTSTTIIHHSLYEDADIMDEHNHGDRFYATDRHLEDRNAYCDTKCGEHCPAVMTSEILSLIHI